MKRAWALLCSIYLFLCFSCNIEAPLDNVLAEANDVPASYIYFNDAVDTLSISALFPGIKSVDSISTTGIDFREIKRVNFCYLAEVKDTSKILHQLIVYSGGRNVSLIVAYDTSRKCLSNDTSYIISKGYLNNRLLYDFSRLPDEFYVLWQNVVLPEGFITFSSHGFSVLIPKEAKKQKQSYIRIFGANGRDVTLDLRVALIYGIPVPTKEWPE
jgi:hypothetical protein